MESPERKIFCSLHLLLVKFKLPWLFFTKNQGTKELRCPVSRQGSYYCNAEHKRALPEERDDVFSFPLLKFLSKRECSKFFGEDGMTLKLFVKRTAPFSILWTLTNYLYLMALKKLTATDVSALYCCHKAFVFLLSWIVLKDRFMGVRVGINMSTMQIFSVKILIWLMAPNLYLQIVAAIMAITGIVMMAYADGFHGDSFVGVALAVGSASTSALYKVSHGPDEPSVWPHI